MADSYLLLRIRSTPRNGQASGQIPLQIEALLNFGSIYRSSPAVLDLSQLASCFASGNGAYESCLGTSIGAATSVACVLPQLRSAQTVRVQVMLEDGAESLGSIRWERMLLPGLADGPIGVDPRTPFSRFIAVNRPEAPPFEDRLFHLLVVAASPLAENLYRIESKLECKSVIDACATLLDRHSMKITVLPGSNMSADDLKELERHGVRVIPGAATLGNIANALQTAPDGDGIPHGLHLIAHGSWNSNTRRFFLLLENESGGLSAQESEDVIQAWRPDRLRLMFLESCQSAVSNSSDSQIKDFKTQIAGFMQLLVEKGVPGVLAMQDAITVDDAREFNRGFYSSLLETGRADVAANCGRQMLRQTGTDSWSIPALATRLPHGDVWTESPLRRAERKLFEKLRQADEDRRFPNFPIDTRVLTPPLPDTWLVDDLPNGVREDVHGRLRARVASARGPICVIGPAGSSRSTILTTAWLYQIQEHWQDRQPAIPVLLRLQDCIRIAFNPVTTIAAAISAYFDHATGVSIDPAYLTDRFREQPFLFLISGDETFQSGSAQDGLNILKDFRSKSDPGGRHKYVLILDQISVSPADLPDDAECLLLLPMSPERVNKYLTELPDTTSASGAGSESLAVIGNRVSDFLHANGLFDMAEVPWLLQEIIDQQVRGVRENSRSQILRRIMNERISDVTGFSAAKERVQQILFHVAWAIQNSQQFNGPEERVPPRQLSGRAFFRILADARGDQDYSLSEFRQQLVDKCRILAPGADRDGVRFAYAGFRVYCAAEYINRQPLSIKQRLLEDITATLGRRSRVEWWGDTLTILAGLQTDTESLMWLLRAVISGSPVSQGDQVFIAARCLQEAILNLDHRADWSSRPEIRSIISALMYRSHSSADASVASRKRAIRALGPLKDPRAVPHLGALALNKVRLDKDGTKRYDYSGVRIAAIKALLYTQQEAIGMLAANPEFAHQTELLNAVQLWFNLDCPGLAKMYPHAAPDVAAIIAFAIGLMKPKDALTLLLQRVWNENDNDTDLLWAITDSVLETGDPAIADRVPAMSQNERLQPYTAYLIGKLGRTHFKPEFRDLLLNNLREDRPSALRGLSLRALAEVGEDVRIQCREWLAGPDDMLRFYALEGLRSCGDQQDLAQLEALQWHYPDSPLFEQLRLEVYDDLYWRLAGGLSREIMAPIKT